MSSSGSSTPITLDSIPNYVELAALIVPQRKLGVKDRLRRAMPFLPMPLSLGWDADPGDEERPDDSWVPGLLLSDIKSGATRHVTARWMHTLYKHTQDNQKPGTLVMHLHEAGYTAHFGWPHALVLLTFLLQFSVVPFAMMYRHKREGWLLLAAGLIRIGEAIYAWVCPKHRLPRSEYRAAPRYCALHTGMTTNHILVLTHRFGYLGKCVILEDAAAPLARRPIGWQRTLENGARGALRVSVWVQKGASLVTAANGYLIPAVLLLGTIVVELVAAAADVLPARAVSVLTTGPSILDRLTAACQVTESISVGFVESLLPDPKGEHEDYNWIFKVIQPDTPLELHPTHPAREDVLESTRLRRRFQNLPPVPSLALPPMAAAPATPVP
ncbi:hypothetical protein DFH06DRAFT_153228 [Mycena polygramma]|nr:hypothetical protein DFH06DRAFT_153228 [Mycena polygramma]